MEQIMFNFIKAVSDILEERGKTTKDLFNDKVVSANTFYKYQKRMPNLKTLFNIANYLEVSLDYLFEFDNENNFHYYTFDSEKFYNKIMLLINEKKISIRKFSLDTHFSRDNLLRWKNGTLPSVQALILMTQYFNCSLDDLLK